MSLSGLLQVRDLYTPSARILRKNIPIAILLSFKDGLEGFLKKLDIDYSFYSSNKILSKDEKLAYAI